MIRGPGIPAGTVTNQLTGTIDVLPTIAAITGQPLPGKKIDGKDVSKLWTGEVAKSPRTEFVHYTSRGDLEGIRSGDWKLLVKKRRGRNAANNPPQVMLFHLGKDVGEKNNVADANPDIVARLQARMQELDAEITKNARAPWMKQ